MGKNQLQLCGIKKSFGNVRVLREINLSVEVGEFITLLGASGCGKTTTLRIIAGLEFPDEGRVLLSGADVTDLEPNKRDVNTVFQNYALFPHMAVEANISYSLKLKHMPKEEIRDKVAEALELVRLSGFEKRMPGELSGGQKQRVAIARAIVNKPKVLLLDEPLGALDLQLRKLMQIELKKLQRQLGITFIYITHDQEEALNMSDRIAVMRNGYLEQTGTAAEIYDKPRTSYVAAFVGNANVLTGLVTGFDENLVCFNCSGGSVKALLVSPESTDMKANVSDSAEQTPDKYPKKAYAVGDKITVAVRGENIEIFTDNNHDGIPAEIRDKRFAGGMLRITMWIRAEDSPENTAFVTASTETLRMPSGMPEIKNEAEKAETPPGFTELVASRHGINYPLVSGQRVRINWAPENAVPVEAN